MLHSYIYKCVRVTRSISPFFREMFGHFASWKKHINQNYSISAALSQLRISNLVDKPAFLIYLQSDINIFKHSSLFYWEKLKAECASNRPVNSKQRAWRRDQIVIVRHLQTFYFFILRFTKVKHFLSDFAEDEEEGRKERGRRMERARGGTEVRNLYERGYRLWWIILN